jgi:hypothetical protein
MWAFASAPVFDQSERLLVGEGLREELRALLPVNRGPTSWVRMEARLAVEHRTNQMIRRSRLVRWPRRVRSRTPIRRL